MSFVLAPQYYALVLHKDGLRREWGNMAVAGRYFMCLVDGALVHSVHHQPAIDTYQISRSPLSSIHVH